VPVTVLPSIPVSLPATLALPSSLSGSPSSAPPSPSASPSAATPAPASVPAKQPFTVCQVDKTVPDGRYEVNNNNFAGKRECLAGTQDKTAFRVKASGAISNSAGSDAFPDIFVGCSWGVCSPNSWLPAKVSDLSGMKTTFDGTENASGIWGAGYDMFLDKQPIHDGQAQVESMIWLNSRGSYNPASEDWPQMRLDGTMWWVMTWETSNGHQDWRYIQFRKVDPVTHVNNLPLGPFLDYIKQEGWIAPSWYLLNVDAGFEIWKGGSGLALTHFSLTR
jgi:hypothetical protein